MSLSSTFTIIVLMGSACLMSPSVASYHDSCRHAFRECDFRFDSHKSIPTFSLSGPADKSFSPRIVSKNRKETLGVLNSNNITPEVLFSHHFTPITHLHTTEPITPTHIKPFSIHHYPGSGIGHQVLSDSQRQVLSGKCIRVFFSEYQVLNKMGHVVKNLNNVPRFANKCVVFRTKN